MSEVYEVTVSDETAQELEEYDDERIREVLRDALDELASTSDKQDELHRRMGVDPDDPEGLSGEALETEMRKWLRGERETDPRLD
ncbi:uncharacterized protein HHUB_3116 [Halobacterium hubeiense]|uniref:Uncharacterized protein n=1 Tax=Halobacterium hubeiense TaxID=1407499 RepID=A0A0U5H2B3_9EURY|nr:hypothetical protein [Halobacterium hubeiense]CQH60026.1 uncharacterized protein HHUB_3116 [Halobacterium hubeiense]